MMRAAATAEAAGLEVIMNRCPKIEFGRLGGELSWSGVNSGIIRNRAGRAAACLRAAQKQLRRPVTTSTTGSRPGRSMPARRPIRQPARDRRRSTRRQPMSFDDVDHAASLFNLHDFGYIYSRLTNPTVSVLEERIAALEGGRAAVAAASGHAAQFLTFFTTILGPGDEFVASRNLYGGSLTQFGLSFKKLGWTCHFVDPSDPENFRKAITPKMQRRSLSSALPIRAESSSISRRLPKVAHEAGLPLIVDNTLATPYLCRPIEHGGPTSSSHSTTKFLAGHGNSLGGVVVESGTV